MVCWSPKIQFQYLQHPQYRWLARASALASSCSMGAAAQNWRRVSTSKASANIDYRAGAGLAMINYGLSTILLPICFVVRLQN